MSLWIQLHTGPPGPDGTHNRSKGNPDRCKIIGRTAGPWRNTARPRWFRRRPVEVVTHFSVWDEIAGGRPLAWGPVGSNSEGYEWRREDTFTLTSLDIYAILPTGERVSWV